MANAIVYGSGFTKHTKNIAEYLGKKIDADVYNAKNTADFDLEKYDTIVLGTNVHAGHSNNNLKKFCIGNKEALSKKRVILFISCLYDGDKGQKQAENIASVLNVNEFAFFSTKGEKGQDGIPLKVNEFVGKYFE